MPSKVLLNGGRRADLKIADRRDEGRRLRQRADQGPVEVEIDRRAVGGRRRRGDSCRASIPAREVTSLEAAVVPLEDEGRRAADVVYVEAVVLRASGDALVRHGIARCGWRRRHAVEVDPGVQADGRRGAEVSVGVGNGDRLGRVGVELERLPRLARSVGDAAVDRGRDSGGEVAGIVRVAVRLEPDYIAVDPSGAVQKTPSLALPLMRLPVTVLPEAVEVIQRPGPLLGMAAVPAALVPIRLPWTSRRCWRRLRGAGRTGCRR